MYYFNKIASLTVIIMGFLIFNGCNQNPSKPEKPNPPDTTGTQAVKVYMPQAQHNPINITLTKDLPDTTVKYSAGIEGDKTAKNDITVHFDINSSLVDEYNSDHSTSLLLLPEDNYTLSKNEETISSGDKEGPSLTLTITGKKPALKKGQDYLLPITVNTNEDNVNVDEEQQTSYFVIQNNISSTNSGKAKPSGQGTKDDPYIIASLDNLKWVSSNPSSWGATFKQTKDIDASPTKNWNDGKGFSIIGKNEKNAFDGTYDGQGHTIKGLYINRPQQKGVGFFGWSGKDAVIMDVHLTEIDITAGKHIGGLAAVNVGEIENSEVSSSQGQIKGSGNSVGGLVGLNRPGGVIKGSQTNVYVNVDGNNVGGLVGLAGKNTKIVNSHATGNVKAKGQAGGLVGDNHGKITFCYATGDVNATEGHSNGGLVGINYAPVKGSYAIGDISAAGSASDGGLIGNDHALISNCYAMGNVESGTNSGGLVGYITEANIKNSYSIGKATASSSAGGLVGSIGSKVTIKNGYWDTETSELSTSAGGAGLKTNEMQGSDAEDHMSGFNYKKVWQTRNGDYPILRDNQPPGNQ
jgi:hypothetical protein